MGLLERKKLYTELENERHSKVIVYATSTRQGMEAQIAKDILPKFVEHLDRIGRSNRISLVLYTNGGDTSVAWSLVNLIRSFCDEFEVIVPANCYSCGTLICLGANNIVMTKQAFLCPIDPSTNGVYNPTRQLPNGASMPLPVSVESVRAYMEMAKNDFNIKDQKYLTEIFLKLSEKIHPLALGDVYRSKSQIKMFAKRLMHWQHLGKKQEQKIINFLCSESGSHDYPIRRKEAKDDLGLNIEKPSEELYRIIKGIYDDICADMELDNPFNPVTILQGKPLCSYKCKRCIIESIDYGSNFLSTDGQLALQGIQVANTITYEGWKHEQ